MLNSRYVSYKRIIEKLYQDYGFKDKVEWSVILEWIGDAIDLIGANVAYINKVTGQDALTPTIKIEEHRGELPCDLYKIIQVREYCNKIPMIASSDTFHLNIKNNVSNPIYTNVSQYTYGIQGGYIYTNFATGEVEMSYIAFPVDGEGFPMIPDDVKFIRAATDYVALKLAKKLYMQNELDRERFQWIEQEAGFSMGAAHTRGSLMNLDEAEGFKNAFLRLIPKIDQHSDGFLYLNHGEERPII